MKHIFILENSVALTGARKSIESFAEILSKDFEFSFVELPEAAKKIPMRTDFRRIPMSFLELRKNYTIIWYLPVLLINTFKIIRLLKNVKDPVLHVNDIYNMCGVLVKIVKPDVKLIYHIRLLPGSYVQKVYKIWQRLIVRYADEIVCVSGAVANHWPKRENIHIIYDAMPAVEKLPAKEIDDSTEIQFLYMANYVTGKGHDKALEAFAKVYAENNRARLKMVGGDMGLRKNVAYKNLLMQRSVELGLTDVVLFENFSDNTEQVMKSADVFLNFSESESFSMTCLEALHYGIPCIATASGGPSEIIEHNVSGMLVPVNDYSGMAAAMLDLASHTEKRRRLSENGKKRVRAEFDLQQQAFKLQALYKK